MWTSFGGDTYIFRLNFPTNNGCAQYCSSAPIGHSSLTWQQPRMNICAIVIALARTDVPRCACRQRLQARFSPRERHHTTRHGRVARLRVQSACNQFEIGQNNKTQEQHSEDVYTLYTEAGHFGGIKSFSVSPAGHGGAESCRHPGDTTYDSLDWFGGVTINHSTI